MRLILLVSNLALAALLVSYFLFDWRREVTPAALAPFSGEVDVRRTDRGPELDRVRLLTDHAIRAEPAPPPPPPPAVDTTAPTETVPTAEKPARERAQEELESRVVVEFAIPGGDELSGVATVSFRDPTAKPAAPGARGGPAVAGGAAGGLNGKPVLVGDYLWIKSADEDPETNGRILAIRLEEGRVVLAVEYRFEGALFALTLGLDAPELPRDLENLVAGGDNIPVEAIPAPPPSAAPAVGARDVPLDWDWETVIPDPLVPDGFILPGKEVDELGAKSDELFAQLEIDTYIDPTTRRAEGLRLTHIPEDSPARKYGAQINDIVISVNGHPVNGVQQAKDVGQRLSDQGVEDFQVVILRRGERITKSFKVRRKK